MNEESDNRPKRLAPEDLPGKIVACVTPARSLLQPFERVFSPEGHMNIFAFRIPDNAECRYGRGGNSVQCGCSGRRIELMQSPADGTENRYTLAVGGEISDAWTCEVAVFGSAAELVDSYLSYYGDRPGRDKVAAMLEVGLSCRGWNRR